MKNVSQYHIGAIILILPLLVTACAYPPDRYNTQRGALLGAGVGALIGQAIGRNTEGTLIGLASGTILGAFVGNAVDQDYQALRDAANYQKPVIYYDKQGAAVEAIPVEVDAKTNCRKIKKRTWKNSKLTSETVEEICEDPVVYYSVPQPAYPYYPRPYYGYSYYPYYPSIHFSFGHHSRHHYGHGHHHFRHHRRHHW